MAFKVRDAIRDKDLPSLTAALEEAGPDFDVNALVNGCTPLSFAAYADFPEGVACLLARRANPERQSYIMDLYHWKGTEAPLHTVCRKIGKNNLEMAKDLLSHGASPAATDSFRVTPLRYAVHNRDNAMIDLLLRNGADPFQRIGGLRDSERTTVIHKVIKDSAGDGGAAFRRIWRWVVEQRQTNRPVDHDGNTALHVAARMVTTPVVETILETCVCESGFSPHVFNKNHESPLAVAVSALRLQTVFAILSHSSPPLPPPSFSLQHFNDAAVTAFHSPLFRAFKIALDDGRNDAGDHCFAGFRQAYKEHRQDLFLRLCDVIADAGYPLRGETWLDNSFDDLRRGPDDVEDDVGGGGGGGGGGPIEFRDVVWDAIPPELLANARRKLDSLREKRRRPPTLKCAARLAVRAALLEGGCLRCRGIEAGLGAGDALGKVTKVLGLPQILREYLLFLNP